MSHSGSKITAPVSILGDLQPVLGTGYKGLGQIITTAKINPMSKFKPVGFPSPAPSRTSTMPVGGKNLWWWQGITKYETVPAGLVIGNYTCIDKCVWVTSCGVKFLGFLSKNDILGAFNPYTNIYHTGDNSILKNNYSYVSPTGGINTEPFRLMDFDNYSGEIEHNTIPDNGTESGTTLVNYNDPKSSKVSCSVMSKAVWNYGAPSELSFNDLYGAFDGGFTVVTGKMATGSTCIPVALSVTGTRSDEFFKEVEIDLHSSLALGSTIVGIYCVSFKIGTDTYYAPVFQSNGANANRPNTPTAYAPNRKCYKVWVVQNVPYFEITFTQKQNYGSSFAWGSVTGMSSFQTQGAMNRWYLRIAMPRKSAAYTFNNTAFKVEMTGMFRNSRGDLILQSYYITSADTRFVLKNNEVMAADWGTTENVTITAGSSVQYCYLAIYDLFANRHSVETIYGGTVWRVSLYFKNGQADFPSVPDVVYGSVGSDHLNISVQSTI